MNKQDLIEAAALRGGWTKADTERVLNAVIGVIEDRAMILMKRGRTDEVFKLVRFGTFKTIRRKARLGHNPQTGEQIKIPARTALKFVPAENLKSVRVGAESV